MFYQVCQLRLSEAKADAYKSHGKNHRDVLIYAASDIGFLLQEARTSQLAACCLPCCQALHEALGQGGLAGAPRAGGTGLAWQWPWEDGTSALGPRSSLPFCFGRVEWASLGLAGDPARQEGDVCAAGILRDWKVLAAV